MRYAVMNVSALVRGRWVGVRTCSWGDARRVGETLRDGGVGRGKGERLGGGRWGTNIEEGSVVVG